MKTRTPTDERHFAELLLRQPEVWELFVHFTIDRIRNGLTHYSADAILHRVRFETETMFDDGSPWRINNDFSSYFARKFREEFPQHASLFRTRASRADRKRVAA